MPKNRERTWAAIGVFVCIAGIGLCLWPALRGLPAGKGGYAFVIMGVLVAFAGLFSAVVYRNRAKVLDGIVAGDGVLAHWTYPDVPIGDGERFREVYVSRGGMWVDGTLVSFDAFTSRCDGATLNGGTLVIRCSTPRKSGRQRSRWEVPVPRGEERRAEAVARTLDGLYRRNP